MPFHPRRKGKSHCMAAGSINPSHHHGDPVEEETDFGAWHHFVV
jgi:hypothetical protein